MKNILLIISSLAVIFAGFLFVRNANIGDVALQGGAGGKYASSCSVATSTSKAIGDDISLTILDSAANRAWAQIEIPANATDEFYLSFDEGTAAVVDEGILIASSTPSIVFGLNTDLPYTGAVTGITANATTTVLLTQCLF